jgi:hypothetical protein
MTIRYFLGRLFQGGLVLLAVATITFGLLYLLPRIQPGW